MGTTVSTGQPKRKTNKSDKAARHCVSRYTQRCLILFNSYNKMNELSHYLQERTLTIFDVSHKVCALKKPDY